MWIVVVVAPIRTYIPTESSTKEHKPHVVFIAALSFGWYEYAACVCVCEHFIFVASSLRGHWLFRTVEWKLRSSCSSGGCCYSSIANERKSRIFTFLLCLLFIRVWICFFFVAVFMFHGVLISWRSLMDCGKKQKKIKTESAGAVAISAQYKWKISWVIGYSTIFAALIARTSPFTPNGRVKCLLSPNELRNVKWLIHVWL